MNYYNEFDLKAAAWLRELIKAGEIPPGDVDTRSITEISPHELTSYTQQHFFAGIGGWSLALKLAGWPVDRPVRTGSCPCQPFSQTGLGLGEKDERHLWPVFRDLITFGENTVTFGEQVASKAGRVWLARVRADLEGVGYGVGAADLCSAGVGSPNIRQRLYWMAYADGGNAIAQRKQRGGEYGQFAEDSGVGRLGNSMREGLVSSPHPGIHCREESARSRDGEPERSGDALRLGHPHQSRPQGRDERGYSGCERTAGATGLAGTGHLATAGNYLAGQGGADGMANAHVKHGDGERSGAGNDSGQQRRPQELRGFWDSFDILPCTDGKARRIEPGSFPLAHGIPGRVGLLRGYGNAINPYLAAEFIEACDDVISL